MIGHVQNDGSLHRDSQSEDRYGLSWGNELDGTPVEAAAEEGTSEERKYYSSFSLDGSKYAPHDTVYVRASDGPPYVAKIMYLYETLPKRRRRMRVRWFCRPCELPEGLPDVDYSENCKDIFLMKGPGAEKDNHPACTIRRCTVLCTAEEEWNENFPSVEMIATADHIFDRSFDTSTVKLRSLNPTVKKFGQYFVTGVGGPPQRTIETLRRDNKLKARGVVAPEPLQHAMDNSNQARSPRLKDLEKEETAQFSRQTKRPYAMLSGEDGRPGQQKKPKIGHSKAILFPQGREGDGEYSGAKSSEARKRAKEGTDDRKVRPKLNIPSHRNGPKDVHTPRESGSELFASSPRVGVVNAEKNERNSFKNDSGRLKSPGPDSRQSMRDGKIIFSGNISTGDCQTAKTSVGHISKIESHKKSSLTVDQNTGNERHREHGTRVSVEDLDGPRERDRLGQHANVDTSHEKRKSLTSAHLKVQSEDHLPSNSMKREVHHDINQKGNGESGSQISISRKTALATARAGPSLVDTANCDEDEDEDEDSGKNSLRHGQHSDNRSREGKWEGDGARPNGGNDGTETVYVKESTRKQHAEHSPPMPSNRRTDMRASAKLESPDTPDGMVKSPPIASGSLWHGLQDSTPTPSGDYPKALFELKKKIFTYSWKDNIRRDLTQKKVLLLQNLDPWFSSFEIEALLMDLLQVNCDVRMLPPRNFACYTSGQALVVFRTTNAAAEALTTITENSLIWSKDERPVVASWAKQQAASYGTHGFFKPGQFSNTLTSTAQVQMDTAVTSHCSQPNTIEYNYGVQWRQLQKRHTLALQSMRDAELWAESRSSLKGMDMTGRKLAAVHVAYTREQQK